MKCYVENSYTAVLGILSLLVALQVHLCGLQTHATLI